MPLLRKITIGTDYKDGMNYSVGQTVWGEHKIIHIKDSGDRFSIFISKDGGTKLWKEAYKSMGICVEFDTNFD